MHALNNLKYYILTTIDGTIDGNDSLQQYMSLRKSETQLLDETYLRGNKLYALVVQCIISIFICVAHSLYEREEFSECLIYLYEQIHNYIGDLSCLRILMGNCYHKLVGKLYVSGY